MKNSNLSNILRTGAIAVPWLCAAILPACRIDGFCQSPLRMLFFDFVMVPFGNIAIIGMTANGQGRSLGLVALLALAGIVLPLVLALCFVRNWKRWQFALVWIGYAVLLAYDTVVATFVASTIIKGRALTWL